ncbi:MAG TPA: DUF4468 domain-containing protein [Candidatus Syntrophosphaera sp.]|nr:DUF4468 domain-containing protein [Candidatus Syntrophosphaera sp.]
MKTRIVLYFIVCVILSGCANSSTRLSMEPGEGVFTFSHEISKKQRDAYFLAVEWLSSSIHNVNEVVTLRQPETGTLIANPSIQIPVSLTSFWGRYTLRINCNDNKLTTTFTVGAFENGAYPPKNAMPGIEENFKIISDGLFEFIENN